MQEFYKTEFEKLVGHIKAYNPKLDVDFLERVYRFSYEAHEGQLRKSTEPYFQHCLEVAKILANLRLDTATIASGLLHDVIEDTETALPEIMEKFGAEVAHLVEGVTGIRRLKTIHSHEKPDENYIEDYIKMLLAVVKDIRVILIKLADRLHNMRTLKHLSEKKRLEIAEETRELYVPLANRLGLAKIKTELEDLIFKFLNNGEYKKLALQVNEKRQKREQYIQSLIVTIQQELSRNAIIARVEGRPKSLYSIHKKSQNRNLAFESMYDLFAIRIIVGAVEKCYAALSVVQSSFKPDPDYQLLDYIKTPKPNGYQSLHTIILSEENKRVEVQIRTEEMHRVAEDGIAAHWRYKEGKLEDSQLDKYLVAFRLWLRQLADWLQDAQDEPVEVLNHLKINLFKDEIFVYTPQGKMLKLPAESTPVDFAFAVHTELGIHCLGAKANGQIVSLRHKLKSGDTVEIIKSANQKPSMEWLNFVRTSTAYAKIQRWFKESLLEQSQKLGEAILQRECKRFGIKKESIDFAALAQIWGLAGASQLYHAVGVNRLAAKQVIKKILPDKKGYKNGLEIFLDGTRQGGVGPEQDEARIRLGQCCQPSPGDRILAFVTRDNGVVAHRSDCQEILKLMNEAERNSGVYWEIEHDKNFLVRLQMLGHDRKSFLREVSDAVARTEASIVSVSMNSQDSFILGHMVIEVANLFHLTRIINQISKVNGVINVERLDGTGEPVADLAGVSPAMV